METTTRELNEQLRSLKKVLAANRDAQTPDGHDAYEEALHRIQKIREKIWKVGHGVR